MYATQSCPNPWTTYFHEIRNGSTLYNGGTTDDYGVSLLNFAQDGVVYFNMAATVISCLLDGVNNCTSKTVGPVKRSTA